MNWLITGGSGCIGAYIIRDLLLRGERVINFDSNPSYHILNQVVETDVLDSLISVRGDITDFKQLCRILKQQRIDVIVHLASLQIPASNADPALAFRVVAGGLVNVLEAARLLELKKTIWASSIAVFGLPAEYDNQAVKNDAYHRPQSIYGACKSLGEYYLDYYHNTYGINCNGLRFSAVYGVGRELGMSSFSTEMIRKAVKGEHYDVPFGDDAIDWQYVEDVSRVVLQVADAGKTKTRIFNTAGEVRPVKDGVNYLKKLVPAASLSVKPGSFGISWDYDVTPLEQEIGFRPNYRMEKGILKTLNLYRQQAGKKPISG